MKLTKKLQVIECSHMALSIQKKLMDYILNFVLIAMAFILSIPSFTYAELKTFTKEYKYQASEDDSKLSSRTVSLREVKRLLLEELGTYLESISEVKDFHLTKDQITTLTAGIVSAEVVEEKWDGKNYWLKAKIAADPAEVIKAIETIRKDREKTKELEEIRKKADLLLKENELLKQESKTAKGKNKKKKQKEYNSNIKRLKAIEWVEKGDSFMWSSEDYISRRNKAIDAYTEAIRIDATYEDAYRKRGETYEWDDPSKALKDFSKAIILNPNSAINYYKRAQTYHLFLRKYQQAIKDYTKAIELKPDFAVAFSSRAEVFSLLHDNQQAIKDYTKAIELTPLQIRDNNQYKYDNPYLFYYGRGNAYIELRNYKQGLKDLNTAIELASQAAKYWKTDYTIYCNLIYKALADAYLDLGNYQQAIKNYDKAIEIHPQEKYYCNRGFAYYNLGNYKQAIQDFDKAIEIDPTYGWSYYGRGIAYQALGNNIKFIEDLKIAAKLDHKQARDILRKIGID